LATKKERYRPGDLTPQLRAMNEQAQKGAEKDRVDALARIEKLERSKRVADARKLAFEEPLRVKYVVPFTLALTQGIPDDATFKKVRQLVRDLRKEPPHAQAYVNGTFALEGGLVRLATKLAEYAAIYID